LDQIFLDPQEARKRALRLQAEIGGQHNRAAFQMELRKHLPTPGLESIKTPTISVIIPCFNQAQFLFASLRSVAEQRIDNLEVVVVDDGSDNPNQLRLLDLAKKEFPEVKFVRKENGGLSSARNVGIEASKGELLQFLDADDLLTPGKLSIQLQFLANNREVDYVYSSCLIGSLGALNESTLLELGDFEPDVKTFLFKWERGFSIPIHSALIRRESLQGLRFSEELRAKEDWVFWSLLALSGARGKYLGCVGGFYRQHPLSMRRDFVKMGESWLEAGRLIESHLADDMASAFRDSTLAWHKSYYLKTVQKALLDPAENQPLVSTESLMSALELWISRKNQQDQNLITVLIPVFSHYNLFKSCLMSVFSQDSSRFEVLIVSDAPEDGRIGELLDQLQDHEDIRVVRLESNLGISRVTEFGLTLSETEFTAFLDADDELKENAVSELNKAIASWGSHVDYFFSDREDIDQGGNLIREVTYGGYPEIAFKSDSQIPRDLTVAMVASHLKVLRTIPASKMAALGSEFDGVQDWKLALEFANEGKSFKYIPRILYRHRRYPNSFTGSYFAIQVLKSHMVRQGQPRKPPSNTIQIDSLPNPIVLHEKFFEGKGVSLNMTEISYEQARTYLTDWIGFLDTVHWSSHIDFLLLCEISPPSLHIRHMLASGKSISLTGES
jgi:glycosyltransferase involved in cell wall biosynthesis